MSDDVEYEFVKGQGWVPKLKQKEKFSLVRARDEAMRQLYNAVYGIDTRRCEHCGVQGQLERVDQRFLTCRYCGRDQRG